MAVEQDRAASFDQQLPEVIGAMGGLAFAPSIFTWLQDQVSLDEIFVFERPFDPGECPSTVVSQGRRPSVAERAQAYCEDFHRLDPINPWLDARSDSPGVVRIGSDQISDRSYRAICYDRPALAEKASFWRRCGSHWLVVSLYRSAEEGPFASEDMSAIRRCGRLLLPIVMKHQALRRLEAPAPESRRALIDRIESRLADLSVTLTPRQLEVCARTAIGMTAEGVALDLGIKTSSVVTHRRRAYDRLGIATGFELTRLLL